MKTIKYIGNNVNHGIKYDWKLIRKEYAKLKCPKVYHNPCDTPLEDCKYFVEFSMRSIGKTTGWLLLGMIMNKLYGTVIQYLRQTEAQIAIKNTQDLFTAMMANGYIEKVTDGRWNAVKYNARRWYYANIDDSGKIIEVSPDQFMTVLVVTNSQDYKSGYNAPTGDLIIYDEFVNYYYYPDEFVKFADLCKTIIRDRLSPIIVMCCNNIEKNSIYYRELEIYEEVNHLMPNETTIKTTDRGTRIFINYIDAPEEKKKHLGKINEMFFGFSNKKLGSITGEDWSIKPRQHIPDGEFRTVYNNIYIKYNNRYIRLDIVQHENLGLCMYVHWATTWQSRELYDDSVILTLSDRYDNRYHFGLGGYKMERLITTMMETNRTYYASNDLGSFLDSYIQEYHNFFK